MPWNIGLDDNDFKILNATNSTTYDNTHYKNYFTIRDDGNVGINNGNPEVKLVVEGDTKINGSVNTSNIIGIPMNTSNILRINYEENYNNNKLEI
jgi:archaellum component FlaG (FlaF/FlaG flagellin family)